MNGLRSRVAKKAEKFVKQAQAVPPAPAIPPPAPTGPAAAPKPPMPAVPGAPKPPMPGVPGAVPPGAPGAPQKSKEEIEQGVEQDIRRRKEQEKKLEDLDQKVTTLGDQLENLTTTIDKLVNSLQKDTGGKTDFEKKLEISKTKMRVGLPQQSLV